MTCRDIRCKSPLPLPRRPVGGWLWFTCTCNGAILKMKKHNPFSFMEDEISRRPFAEKLEDAGVVIVLVVMGVVSFYFGYLINEELTA